MTGANKDLIKQMTDELEPVRAMRPADGLLLVAMALIATVLLVAFVDGLWRDGLTGGASPYFYITNGLLLLLGLASATSVITMATPRVGNRHDGPRWAMAMLGVMPAAAMVALLSASGGESFADDHALQCVSASLLASVASGGVLFAWLKRGAPVSPTAAGLHLGVAAGALGSVAYGLSCTIDGVAHLGLWHVAPVVITGALGRLLGPRLLRW